MEGDLIKTIYVNSPGFEKWKGEDMVKLINGIFIGRKEK